MSTDRIFGGFQSINICSWFIYIFVYRYDFNSDGLISREDIRLILSYIPYKRTLDPTDLQKKRSSLKSTAGNITFSEYAEPYCSKSKEGLYGDDEGKAIDYKDRSWDQEEINHFLKTIFGATSSK